VDEYKTQNKSLSRKLGKNTSIIKIKRKGNIVINNLREIEKWKKILRM